MKKTIAALMLITALLTACGKSGGMNMDHSSSSSNSTAGMDHSAMAKETDSNQAKDVTAKFMLTNEKPQPNQDTLITIHIQDKNGQPIDKFDVVHEKQLHFIVVSKDLSFFNHIHPDYKGKGEFTITTQFPASGQYELIADFTPNGLGAMNKSQWITVTGDAPAAKPIEPDTSLTKVVDGKEVTLSIDHLMANMEANVNFNIKDAQSNKPISDLQPYLGAVGHVVILNQDGSNYLHVHPTEEKSKGPDAKFMTTFPHSGVFKIWGQFQQNGKVFTVPFVVKVP